VVATVQGDVPLPSGSGACASCHRRSGIGTAEAGARTLTITSSALFAATTKPPIRPAYDEASLAAALIGGVAVDGRKLDGLMPRYRLDAGDVRALVAYLRTLGAEPGPGVTDSDLEVATIVAADAPEAKRNAVLETLERFVAIKNAGTRREADRAAAAMRHQFGQSRDRAYRRWNLSVWTLTGAPSTWDAQLAARYAEKTPFAVLSGVTDHDWSIVHDFCERHELPCILPLDDAPATAGKFFYTLYYSSGAVLEARVTATSIARTLAGETPRVLLVYRDDEQGRSARDAFAESWKRTGLPSPDEQAVAPTAVPSARDWHNLLRAVRPTTMIAWLDRAQLGGLTAAGGLPLPRAVYTAESFTDWRQGPLSDELRQRLRHMYPYTLPRTDRTQFQREELWLRARGLESLSPLPAAKALFAGHVFGEALADMEGVFSREYLLETLEHSLDNTQMTSIYPTTTLGPDQRTVSRGVWLTRVADLSGPTPFLNPEWIEP
jgi:hypothetical protein